jgi:TetR/AcrR family transcriptional regulator
MKKAEILDAATAVFLRYGYRKTSMDDLARAAGLSRQGLYLHFRTKNVLFQAVVEHAVATTRAAARAALDSDGCTLAERLTGALTALHGPAAASVHELLGTPPLDPVRREVSAGIADLLRRNGIETLWQETGVTADDLAEHLLAVAAGAGQPGDERVLAVAVRVVTRAALTPP